VRKFIFLSSILTFGEVETPVVDENTPIRNPGIYGISKYFSEKALEEVAEKLSSISLRIPGIIGLGAHRVWLPRCVEKMLNNEPVTIFNPAASFNNAVHIEDLSRFIVTLVNHSLNGHEVVTLGAKGMTSISGAMETLVSSLNSRSEIIEAESEQTTFTISIEKARKHFGYAPMDIEKMLKYYARETLDAISQETSELA
jgi:nucleoside-diphosphate-sugar epimerase